jgi:hypothetical protein
MLGGGRCSRVWQAMTWLLVGHALEPMAQGFGELHMGACSVAVGVSQGRLSMGFGPLRSAYGACAYTRVSSQESGRNALRRAAGPLHVGPCGAMPVHVGPCGEMPVHVGPCGSMAWRKAGGVQPMGEEGMSGREGVCNPSRRWGTILNAVCGGMGGRGKGRVGLENGASWGVGCSRGSRGVHELQVTSLFGEFATCRTNRREVRRSVMCADKM